MKERKIKSSPNGRDSPEILRCLRHFRLRSRDGGQLGEPSDPIARLAPLDYRFRKRGYEGGKG